LAIENLTNPRVRDEAGTLRLAPPEDRISGPGTTPIMAAFTHLNPAGSRFTDGTWGVYYAGESLETAVAETMHHRARFLAATHEDAIEIDMRHYVADLAAPLHDLRGLRPALPAIYDPDDYTASQALARQLRLAGSWGVAYDSVRRPGGQCAAVYRRPGLPAPCPALWLAGFLAATAGPLMGIDYWRNFDFRIWLRRTRGADIVTIGIKRSRSRRAAATQYGYPRQGTVPWRARPHSLSGGTRQ